MKLQFPTPSLGAPQHPLALCALLAPKQAVRSQPLLKLPLLPYPNYNQTIPASAFSSPSSFSPSPSHNPNTIEYA